VKKIFFIAMIFEFGFLLYASVAFSITSSTPLFVKILISALLIVDSSLYLIFSIVLKKYAINLILFNLFIIVNIVFTFTDQVGVIDYIILLINVFIIIFYNIERYLDRAKKRL